MAEEAPLRLALGSQIARCVAKPSPFDSSTAFMLRAAKYAVVDEDPIAEAYDLRMLTREPHEL